MLFNSLCTTYCTRFCVELCLTTQSTAFRVYFDLLLPLLRKSFLSFSMRKRATLFMPVSCFQLLALGRCTQRSTQHVGACGVPQCCAFARRALAAIIIVAPTSISTTLQRQGAGAPNCIKVPLRALRHRHVMSRSLPPICSPARALHNSSNTCKSTN